MPEASIHLSAGAVVVGICLITLGASMVIDSASSIARQLGVSELVVGLTVVAAGTSAPEFAVTILSTLQGQGDISVGNVVGSNIFNLGFILGGCALAQSIPTTRELVFRDGTLLAAAAMLLLALVGFDLSLDRGDGALLFSILVVYLAVLYRSSRTLVPREADAPEQVRLKPSGGRSAVRLMAGFALLICGAEVLVNAATIIARAFEVSEWVIAVTVIAAGTSLPEFATSMAGVLRRRFALSAGNLIGSDLFNLLGVLGVAGLLNPVSIDASARFSLTLMPAMVLLVLWFMRSQWRVSRSEGLVLVGISAGRWIIDYSTQTPP